MKVLLPMFLALHLLSGCSAEDEKAFEREFIVSCSAEKLPEAVCQCLFTELKKDYSIAEMTLWAFTQPPENAFDKARLACGLRKK